MLIYAAIAAVGFLLLLLMLVAGEFLGDGHDLGVHDGAADHGDVGGPSVFSVRVMSAFVTAFGIGGLVARYYGLSHPAASGVGAMVGLVMAGAVYQFGKFLFSQQASSEVRTATLIGRSGEVTVAISENGLGQITMTVGGERTDHIARSDDGHAIPRGAEVTVTGMRGDSLVVARPTEARGGS
jgi:membrane protein implicated in regulation of membrane protease activity